MLKIKVWEGDGGWRLEDGGWRMERYLGFLCEPEQWWVSHEGLDNRSQFPWRRWQVLSESGTDRRTRKNAGERWGCLLQHLKHNHPGKIQHRPLRNGWWLKPAPYWGNGWRGPEVHSALLISQWNLEMKHKFKQGRRYTSIQNRRLVIYIFRFH